MPDRPNLVYEYDGTFEGLLCCVFESFDKKEIPSGIRSLDDPQGTLYPVKSIETDLAKSGRVWASIPKKICPEAADMVRLGFLTCEEEKELLILKFLRLGFRCGKKVVSMLADDTVNALWKAVQFLKNESHLYVEFLRFTMSDGVLISTIAPKNQVLPVLASHFCSRLKWETFMIYDKTHGMALVYQNQKHAILPVDDLAMPAPDENERRYRELWKLLYRTIAVEGRLNPKCRMAHMPKRYWDYMTEFEDDHLPAHGLTEAKAKPALPVP